MEFQFLVPLFGIVCGTLLTGVIFWKIFDVIKAWINRNNSSFDEEKFDRLAKAFIKHKKNSERRLQNIEAILTEGKSGQSINQLSEKDDQGRIEINDTDQDSEEESDSEKLPNMLNKRRTQS